MKVHVISPMGFVVAVRTMKFGWFSAFVLHVRCQVAFVFVTFVTN